MEIIKELRSFGYSVIITIYELSILRPILIPKILGILSQNDLEGTLDIPLQFVIDDPDSYRVFFVESEEERFQAGSFDINHTISRRVANLRTPRRFEILHMLFLDFKC
jgi:hypothetical protein